MSTLSKDQVKEIIKYNNFQSVADVSAYLRDIFKDTIQELLEAKVKIEEERKKSVSDGSTDGHSA